MRNNLKRNSRPTISGDILQIKSDPLPNNCFNYFFQENVPPGRLFSAVRGRLRRVASSLQAAIRFRRLSRRESHPPDWFVDKSHQDETTEKEESPEPKCCGHRVIVDPALPSHYKVISFGESSLLGVFACLCCVVGDGEK